MSSFSVKDLFCKSFITNELLDIIATQIASEEGLTSVVLQDFKEPCGPFDESLLDRIAQLFPKLQRLEVTEMFELSSDSRQQLTQMVIKVINTNLLSYLNLQKFSFDNDADHGEQILEALCASNINLQHLDMSRNESWWTRQDCRELL